jgi:hypothetical protein
VIVEYLRDHKKIAAKEEVLLPICPLSDYDSDYSSDHSWDSFDRRQERIRSEEAISRLELNVVVHDVTDIGKEQDEAETIGATGFTARKQSFSIMAKHQNSLK